MHKATTRMHAECLRAQQALLQTASTMYPEMVGSKQFKAATSDRFLPLVRCCGAVKLFKSDVRDVTMLRFGIPFRRIYLVPSRASASFDFEHLNIEPVLLLHYDVAGVRYRVLSHWLRLQNITYNNTASQVDGPLGSTLIKEMKLHHRSLWGCTLIARNSTNMVSLGRHTALPKAAPASLLRCVRTARLPPPAETLRALRYTRRCFSLSKQGRSTRHRISRPAWGASTLLQHRFLLSVRGGQQQQLRETSLELSGLTCGSCVVKAERALLSVEGVLEVNGNFVILNTAHVRSV